ncbi:uncharacterized protein LOC141643993 [Silene latifolia]|uniref:uncharacterized protein LOC141643993 n=1 Tax=Silene latifolia TaxID=37657 RepID=UPI003D7833A0
MLRPQTPNLLQNSNILGNVPNFVNQNNHVSIYTSAPYNNNSMILAGNNYGNSMTSGLSVNPKPFGSFEKKSKLTERIEQIRHEYWTKEKPAIDAENKLNEPVISDEELDMLLEPDLQQNEDEQQTNVFGETTIPELGDTNFDNDIFLDEIFAELREDFGM